MSSTAYISTRGRPGMDEPLSFLKILLLGLAPDGGLYLPESYPKIDSATLQKWSKLTWQQLAFEILSLFIGDIMANILKPLIDKTFTEAVFGKGITPVTELRPRLFIQHLSNGPTLAFKDLPLQMLGNFFEYALELTKQVLNLLGATSGDTGSAAIAGVLGKKRIRIFVMHPQVGMSPFQGAQMDTVDDPNVFNIGIKGSFDDCQTIFKEIAGDADFKKKFSIGSVNSVNWARIMTQVVYYFYGYFQVKNGAAVGQKVDFVVPSGNFGNMLAGHIAREMGLPIRFLVAATNSNDILDEFFRTGKYNIRGQRQITISPSMDITKASNLERFVFQLLGRDSRRTAELFGQPKGFELNKKDFERMGIEFGMASGMCTDAECLQTIKKIWAKFGVMIDPHTAVAVKVALERMGSDSEDDTPVIVLETAQACKFDETMFRAIGKTAPRPPALEGLERQPHYVTKMMPDVGRVKEFIKKNALLKA